MIRTGSPSLISQKEKAEKEKAVCVQVCGGAGRQRGGEERDGIKILI